MMPNADSPVQATRILQDGLPSFKVQNERILNEKLYRQSKSGMGFQALQQDQCSAESASILSQPVDTVCETLPSLVELEPNRGKWQRLEGSASPLEATWMPIDEAYNFALCSKHASEVILLLYAKDEVVCPVHEYKFDPLINKSGRIWHCRVPLSVVAQACYYAYRVSGSNEFGAGHCFDEQKILIDPMRDRCIFPRHSVERMHLCPEAMQGVLRSASFRRRTDLPFRFTRARSIRLTSSSTSCMFVRSPQGKTQGYARRGAECSPAQWTSSHIWKTSASRPSN
jgi:hypothetical protein